jgi:hypothetical protein
MQWNKLFLTVVGILRVLIDSNKKLILHMLKSLIQKNDYFTGKGDHILASHAQLLQDLGNKASLTPPLADLIQLMRDESQEHHRNLKKPNQTDLDKKACDEKLVKVRNLKLLIQDIFKQFDLLFKEIDIQE